MAEIFVKHYDQLVNATFINNVNTNLTYDHVYLPIEFYRKNLKNIFDQLHKNKPVGDQKGEKHGLQMKGYVHKGLNYRRHDYKLYCS